MNVKELKEFLKKSGLPDDAEVVISGRNDVFYVCSAEATAIREPNGLGQAEYSARLEQGGVRNALLMRDGSSG